jgi:hypothetical protein
LRMIGYSSNNNKWSTVSTYNVDPEPKMGTPLATCCYNSTFYSGGKVTSDNVSLPALSHRLLRTVPI